MNRLHKVLLPAIFAACFLFQQRAVAQLVVPNGVLGNGGAVLSDSSFHVVAIVGETIVGVASNASQLHQAGFGYLRHEAVTEVGQALANVPTEYRLEQNYPNPFNPTTTIRFALPQSSKITLQVFDVLGREVATLADERMEIGEHKIIFDARGLPSGLYLYRLQAGSFVQQRKAALIK